MSVTLTVVHIILNTFSLRHGFSNTLHEVVKGTQVEIDTRLRCWISDANASAVAKDCTFDSLVLVIFLERFVDAGVHKALVFGGPADVKPKPWRTFSEFGVVFRILNFVDSFRIRVVSSTFL
jgi:hypothetical protein